MKYVVRHTGGFNGFSTVLSRELYNHNAIIILTNKGQDTWQRGPTMVALLNILDNKPFEFPKIPIQLTMKNMIDENGVDESITLYRELKKNQPDTYDFSERRLNSLGYYYLNKEKYEESKAILKLNTEIYPNSANVYDSYGDACMKCGDIDEAIKNYKWSLKLNPDNTNAVEMLKQINEKMMNIQK